MTEPDARGWACRLNDALCSTVVDVGGTAVGLATVALDDGERAAKDLRAAMARAELTGLMPNTNPSNDIALHERGPEPLWTVAEELDGRLIDNTIAVTGLILHGVLDRHPRPRLVLVHGGGFLPYAAARLDGGHRVRESGQGAVRRVDRRFVPAATLRALSTVVGLILGQPLILDTVLLVVMRFAVRGPRTG